MAHCQCQHVHKHQASSSAITFLGKVVLITGASSGIGAATALQFSKLGATLAISGRNVANLEKVGAQCAEVGEKKKPLIVVGDMGNEKDVENLLNKTIEVYGKLDVLVNNAGVLENGSILKTDLGQYDRVFRINVRSVYQLTMLAAPYLIKSNGNIVNLSSVVATRAFPDIVAYCTSKAAVDQLTRCAALDLAPKVRVNAVNPGVILTELHNRSGMTPQEYQQFLEKSKVTHALGRAGKPEEVARTIAFLASDHASFITGASVPVDGGRHAMCPR